MFNSVAHRQAIVLMLVLLYGIWIGRVGLLETWPVAGYSETGALRTNPSNINQDTSPNAVASNGAQSLERSDSDEPAGNNTTKLLQNTVERTDPLEAAQPPVPSSSLEETATPALWQAPIQTVDGDIVISLEAAGVPQADAQNPAENILGLIVQAN
ncbi:MULTISPECIES: hypothetical protein [Methylomonas]|nr:MULTISPECIES: hypothetical protein [Methylomonas]TCV83182.1 hypothetical protein EDE11_110141 [Methylomonas methanica]